MPEKIKFYLVKALVIPALTYPAYPLNALSKTATLKLQKILNKSLRFVYNQRYPYTLNTEELHRLASIQPINITLYNRGRKTMDKLTTTIRDPKYNEIINNNDQHEHSWFKKSFLKLINAEPPPIYTR